MSKKVNAEEANPEQFKEHFPALEEISRLYYRKEKITELLKGVNEKLEHLRKNVVRDELLEMGMKTLTLKDGRKYTLYEELSVKPVDKQVKLRTFIIERNELEELTIHSRRIAGYLRSNIVDILKHFGHSSPELEILVETKSLDNKDLQKHLDDDERQSILDGLGLEIKQLQRVDGGKYTNQSIIPHDLEEDPLGLEETN